MSHEPEARRFGAIVQAVAIFAAPFLALLFRAEAGLAVMVAALAAAAYLLHEAMERVPDGQRRPLRIVVAIDLALAIACLVALIWLVVWD